MKHAILFLLLAASALAADIIYVNGNVLTVDGAKTHAEAFAIDNGRFTAVGTNAEIRRLATPASKIVDLKRHDRHAGLRRRTSASCRRLC